MPAFGNHSSGQRRTVRAVIDRIERERARPEAPHSHQLHSPGLCAVDPGEFTVELAHLAMQVHLECTTDICRVRQRARNTLVDSRRMVPNERAERWPR